MPHPRPARVLFVHHRPELGGAPESLAYLIRELDRSLFEPSVYCPPGPAAKLFREAGAAVHTGPVAGFTHIWASTYRGARWLLLGRELLRLPAHALPFQRLLRSGRFSLVHLNDSPLIPAAWLAHRERLPVVWHLRSSLPDGGADRRSTLVRRAIRRLATASIAINEEVAEVFGVGSVVVPNSVDLGRFHPGDRADAKREASLDPDRPVVSFFGFLYPSKGFREFIEAAALVRGQGVGAVFLAVGGAVRSHEFFTSAAGRGLELAGLARDYETEARGRVDELGLRDVVRFVPFTPEIAGLYRASDVVVAPSQGPELGRPVLEAAASGIPVVASGSRTGSGVLVPGETGVLVDRPDAAALAGAVAGLLGDPERRARLGANARRHAERTFDPVRNARAVESVYASILGPSLTRSEAATARRSSGRRAR
jgi:glycosyltransferase involved in cell wall biosynthesis